MANHTSRMKPLYALQSGVTAKPKLVAKQARPAVSPADVVSDVAKRFNDRSRAAFIGSELSRLGPVSSAADALRCSRVLTEAGLFDEAELLFRAMLRAFPRHPGAFVGLAQVAMRRKSWPEALTRWDSILTTFDGQRNVFWLSARAMALYELGQHREATDLLVDLVREFPDKPPGYVGLAQIALRQRRWPEALARCDEVLGRFGHQPGSDGWRVMRASALLEFGRAAEAEAIVRNVVERSPGSENALMLLLWVYASTGRPEVALRVLNSSPLREIETLALAERRLDLLIRLKRFETWGGPLSRNVRASVEAGVTFTRMLERARRPDELSGLFGFVPALYEGRERQRIWGVLLQRAAAMRSSLKGSDQVTLDVLTARIRLALRDRKGVIKAMRDLAERPHLGEHGEALCRIAAILCGPGYPDYSKPKLFGIGLSKTGTTTLAAALTVLGFNTLHWSNPLTCALISDDDLPIFDAFTDTPITTRFESFYDLFPNSKFIFTTRPFDSWVTSLSRHWRRHLGMSDFDQIKAAMEEPRAFHYGIELRNIDRSLYFKYRNYREAFEAHQQRVQQFFRDKPADRFLELNIVGGDGWPELCAFVGRDVPSVAFPWENRQPYAPVTGPIMPPGVNGSRIRSE